MDTSYTTTGVSQTIINMFNSPEGILSLLSMLMVVIAGGLLLRIVFGLADYEQEPQEEEEIVGDLDEAIQDRKVIIVGKDAFREYARMKDMQEYKKELKEKIR